MPHEKDRPDPKDRPGPDKPPSSIEYDQTIQAGEERTISSSGSGAAPGPSTGRWPESIGRYRILGKLGEGGMGIVYEAEQQEPRRRVALKVVRGGHFVDESTIRMFRREVETLARLRHPNIGAIYESGRTEDGQHFFAMELVVGDNLDAFLAGRPKSLTPDEVRFRLALFLRIADAVHYAHQRGVIHRDLKPSNIIVTRETPGESSVITHSGIRTPEVKVLDFGLARITEGDVQVTQVTEVGVIKGTLPYMSPEQARGHAEAIDVRTDVYALGVILYEMLASAKPYDVSRASLIEAVRVICEEPPRSMRTTIGGAHRIDPDIETIVGKALEKDADRRYVSAAAMAEDVERYLASQPILARPPSTLYQLRKFAGRNRALVAGVAATFVVLVAGVAVSSLEAVRALRAENLATSRMARAETAEALAKRHQKESEQARSLAEQRRQEADRERLAADRERSAAVRARSAAERERQAAEAAREAEATQRQAAEASGQQARMEAAKAGAINRFLQNMLATADPWEGGGERVTLDAALRKAQGTLGNSTEAEPEVDAAVRSAVATAFEGVGRYPEAESLLYGSIRKLRREPQPRPALVAGLGRQLGGTLIHAGRYAEAETQFREALGAQALAGGVDSDTMASTLNSLASALGYMGRYREADSLARGALEALRRRGAGRGPVAPDILSTLSYIAANWREDYVAADSLLRMDLELRRALPEDRPLEVSSTLMDLASNKVRMNDLVAADSIYGAALAIRRRLLGEDHPLVAVALENQGNLYYRTGHLDQTVELLRKVLDIRGKGLGTESLPVGRSWISLGSVYAQAGRLPEADDAYGNGVRILRHTLGARHPDVAAALKNHSDVCVQLGRLEDAEARMRESLAIRLEQGPPGSPGVVNSQLGLAAILKDRGSKKLYPEAEALLLRARTAADSARGAQDPAVQKATQGLVELYRAWGRADAAAKWRAALAVEGQPAAR